MRHGSGGVYSLKVLRAEPKFDYSLACKAEFEKSVVSEAKILQHARNHLKIQGFRRVT
jgi:hypothetical protein